MGVEDERACALTPLADPAAPGAQGARTPRIAAVTARTAPAHTPW
ncbi:hypothetical protein [Streptomyces sp. NPDC057002]